MGVGFWSLEFYVMLDIGSVMLVILYPVICYWKWINYSFYVCIFRTSFFGSITGSGSCK
jgi:hypothetical protein